MKKVIPLLLSVVLLFSSTLRPVLAADFDDTETIGYSVNYAGDTLVFTDDDGLILEVRPNDSTAYSSVGGSLLISAAGGAMGVGSATILAGALPLLPAILASGFIVYSVQGLAQCVTDIYFLLSDAAKAELQDIVNSGAESFTFTSGTAAEISAAMGEVFYNDDGTFRDSGITFDPTNMLEYNYDTQYVYGQELTSSIYKYSLSSSPVTFEGTSLSLSLVSSPFNNPDINTAFRVLNTVTGATLTFMVGSSSAWLEDDHCIYSVSAPTVETHSHSSGDVDHTLGFWVLRQCPNLSAGGICTQGCAQPYISKHFGEALTLASAAHYLFANTGIAGLDGNIFGGQFRNDIKDSFDLPYVTPIDGKLYFALAYSVMTTICSAMTYDITANPPVDDDKPLEKPLFVPPSYVLDNLNRLTQAGSIGGDWAQELEGADTDTPGSGTDTDTPDNATFWAKLWAWLTSILAAIEAIPQQIWDALSSGWTTVFDWCSQIVDAIIAIPQSIIDGITAVLEWLFVPDLTDIEGLIDVYSSKFGWATDIYNYIVKLFDRLTMDEPPKVPINLDLAESKYDWGGKDNYVLDMTWYARYKDSVDTILSGIIWIFFLWRLFRRIPDILSGAGIYEESSTLERGHVWLDRAEREERRSRRK